MTSISCHISVNLTMILNRRFDKKHLYSRRKIEEIYQENTAMYVHKNKILEMIMSHSSGAIYYKQR